MLLNCLFNNLSYYKTSLDDLDPDLKYASILGAELTTKTVEEIDLT